MERIEQVAQFLTALRRPRGSALSWKNWIFRDKREGRTATVRAISFCFPQNRKSDDFAEYGGSPEIDPSSVGESLDGSEGPGGLEV
jgi:hypothetical protein